MMSRDNLEFLLYECKVSREKINEASARLEVLEHYIKKSLDDDAMKADALTKFISKH